MKPIIGLTSSFNWDDKQYALPDSYVQAIEKNGGTPIILPQTMEIDTVKLLELVDGIILTGGVDIDPYVYGEPPIPQQGRIDPVRDHFEISIAKQAISMNKPTLAICRGCQILNVAAGGSLYQDINTQIKGSLKHSGQAPTYYPTHPVKLAEKSKLAEVYGSKTTKVNSFHHQGVKALGKELEATAWADDNTIEGIEHKKADYIIGVQWHPERMLDSDQNKIFKHFIDKIKALKS